MFCDGSSPQSGENMRREGLALGAGPFINHHVLTLASLAYEISEFAISVL